MNGRPTDRPTVCSVKLLTVCSRRQLTLNDEVRDGRAVGQRSTTHDIGVDLIQVTECQLRQTDVVLQQTHTDINTL